MLRLITLTLRRLTPGSDEGLPACYCNLYTEIQSLPSRLTTRITPCCSGIFRPPTLVLFVILLIPPHNHSSFLLTQTALVLGPTVQKIF